MNRRAKLSAGGFAIFRSPGTNALDRLTGFGPRGGLLAIIAGLSISVFSFGYFVVYWRHADMDFMVIYNALALNDGKPQQFFDHPAYLTILAVKIWFQFLHAIGWLDAFTLSAIPSAKNSVAFDVAMTQAVRAGRILAWLMATGIILIFAALMRRISRDWRVVLLATFAFAFSGGIAAHIHILRSELIAGCFVIFALMLLIAVGRQATIWRPAVMAIVAALCVLGLENKVHAVFLIAALPALALTFGSHDSVSAAFWKNETGRYAAAMFGILAILAIWAAYPIITAGLDPAAVRAFHLRPAIAGMLGLYQCALMLWIATATIVFAVLWRVSPAECIATIFAMAAGAALALLALDMSYNIGNVVAVINPLEKMLSFADPSTATATEAGFWGIASLLLDGIKQVFARLTFVFHPSPRPAVFLVWLIVPGIVYAWLRGERQVAVQALLLLLVAIGIDSLGVRRGLKSEYFIFTDPLLIIAGVVLVDRMPDLALRRWAYPIGACLMILHIVISQSELAHDRLKRSGPEDICQWNDYFMPLLPLPWCATPPAS